MPQDTRAVALEQSAAPARGVSAPALAEDVRPKVAQGTHGVALAGPVVYSGRVDGAPYEHFGWTLTVVGDVDGDGAMDVAVGVRPWVPGLTSGVGRVALLSGRTRALLWDVAGRGAPEGVDEEDFSMWSSDTFGGKLAAVGDVDRDGTSDLLVVGGDDFMEQAYTRLLSARDGSVRATWPAGPGVSLGTPVVVGDVDGDGSPEFGLTRTGWGEHGVETTIVSGLDRRRVSSVPSMLCLPTGDVDGDGVRDWLARGAGFMLVSGAVVTGRAAPDGPTILAHLPGPFAKSYIYAPAGDHDGDGFVDVVRVGYLEGRAANQWPAAEQAFELEVVSGRDGERLHRTRVELGAKGGSLGFVGSAGDLDGDGKDELAVVRRTTDARLEVWSSAANWRPIAVARSACWSFGGAVVNLGDVDADGHPELAIGDLECELAGPCSGAVHILSWRLK